MSLSRTAIDATVQNAKTLLEFHLGMVKLGMGPSEVNPKLIEAAQAVVRCSFLIFFSSTDPVFSSQLELEGHRAVWSVDHPIQDLFFRIRTQLEHRSNRDKTPDVKGVIMADSSLTNTAVYRKLKNLTKLIHEIRNVSRGSDDTGSARRVVIDGEELAPAAVIIPTAPAAMVRGRGGKRKNPPRASVSSFISLTLSSSDRSSYLFLASWRPC